MVSILSNYYLFKQCAISNAMDDTEDDLLWEELALNKLHQEFNGNEKAADDGWGWPPIWWPDHPQRIFGTFWFIWQQWGWVWRVLKLEQLLLKFSLHCYCVQKKWFLLIHFINIILNIYKKLHIFSWKLGVMHTCFLCFSFSSSSFLFSSSSTAICCISWRNGNILQTLICLFLVFFTCTWQLTISQLLKSNMVDWLLWNQYFYKLQSTLALDYTPLIRTPHYGEQLINPLSKLPLRHLHKLTVLRTLLCNCRH